MVSFVVLVVVIVSTSAIASFVFTFRYEIASLFTNDDAIVAMSARTIPFTCIYIIFDQVLLTPIESIYK
jgi:Na+-driven multidrug efflux pump